MTLSADTIQWALGLALTALGGICLRLVGTISQHQNRIQALELRTPTPTDLAQSIAGIGARVGDLESQKEVDRHIFAVITSNTQELTAIQRETTALVNDLRLTLTRLETTINTHMEPR